MDHPKRILDESNPLRSIDPDGLNGASDNQTQQPVQKDDDDDDDESVSEVNHIRSSHHEEKSDGGESLLNPPYARIGFPFDFWIDVVFAGLMGAFIGLYALGFLNALFEVPKLWLTADGNGGFPDDPETLKFLAGRPWWIGVGAGSGLVVGILKGYIFKFDDYPSFIVELHELHTHPILAFKIAVCSLLSLFGGASLGPEAGLGASCCAIGVMVTPIANLFAIKIQQRRRSRETTAAQTKQEPREQLVTPGIEEAPSSGSQHIQEASHVEVEPQALEIDDPWVPWKRLLVGDMYPERTASCKRMHLFVLMAMVAAFASILPSPLAAVMLCFELSEFRSMDNFGLSYLRTVPLVALCGTASFMVYMSLEGETFLGSESSFFPGFVYRYQAVDVPIGILFGMMGASLGICYFVVAAIVKLVLKKLKAWLDSKVGEAPRKVLLATFGGAMNGLIAYLLPLTVGDGSMQMSSIVLSGEEIGSSVLAVSCFAKMFTYWISAETGLVGGIFFPLLSISMMLGRVFMIVTNVNPILAVSCSFVSLAAAITPMPIAMTILAMSALELGPYGSVPLFLSVVTSHVLLMGVGIPQSLLAAAKRAREKHEAKPMD